MNKQHKRLVWHDFVACEEWAPVPGEIEALGRFLKASRPPGACTSVSMADGFCTALVIGPYDIPRKPNESLELIWGDTSNKRMKGGWTRREWKMFDIACRRVDNISYCVEHDRAGYEPLILDDNNNGDQNVPSIVEWCRGFVKFFNICPQAWVPIFEVESRRALMAPFIYFGTESGWTRKIADKYDLSSYREEFAEHLSHYVFAIKDYFMAPWFVQDMEGLLEIVSPHWDIPTSAVQSKNAALNDEAKAAKGRC